MEVDKSDNNCMILRKISYLSIIFDINQGYVKKY